MCRRQQKQNNVRHFGTPFSSSSCSAHVRGHFPISKQTGHLIRLGYNKKWKMETGAASCSDEYPQQITIIYARSHSVSSGTGKGGTQDVRQEPEEGYGSI